MKSKHRRPWVQPFSLLVVLVGMVDYAAFHFSLLLGYLLWVRFPWHGHWQYFADFSQILWVLPPLAVLVFKAVGLYKPEMGILSVQEQSLIFKAIWVIYFIFFSVTFFYRVFEVSRLATLYSMVLAMFSVSFERYFFRRLFAWLNESGIANRKAVIFGAGFRGTRLARWIHDTPQLGIQVIGFLDDEPQTLHKAPESLPILGGLGNLGRLYEDKDISVVFISQRNLSEDRVMDIIQRCRKLRIQCWVIPSLYQFHVEHVEMQHIGGIPLLAFREPFGRRFYEIFKMALDKTAAVCFVILTSPVWAAIAISIYVTAGLPIFFKQIRVGRGEKHFMMYKFRTLKSGTKKAALSPELEKSGEKAATPLGPFLRRSGLDELPQLINVLRGEMSMIGPRPEMPFLVERYGPLEKERLNVQPGITGLWQISEDRKRLLIHENMDYDLYYVEHMSFNLDFAIAVKTIAIIVKRFFKTKI